MKKFELGEFNNMMLCFGEIFITEEAKIKRGNILEDDHYYKFTFKYKNKKKIYYVPATEVYNKDFKEAFPII